MISSLKSVIPPKVRSGVSNFWAWNFGHKKPSKKYRSQILSSITDSKFETQATRLCESGVLMLPSYFSVDVIQQMKMDVATSFDEKLGGTDALLLESEALSYSAVDPYLTALVGYYLGRPPRLATTGGMRLEPVKDIDVMDGTCWWHHDAKENQVKIYILLTDLPEDGQCLDYIPGTHRMVHRASNPGYYNENFYSDHTDNHDVSNIYGKPIRCYGDIGSVIVFDTNGLHRGNRNDGPRRDVWQHSYTSGDHLYPLAGLKDNVVESLDMSQNYTARLI